MKQAKVDSTVSSQANQELSLSSNTVATTTIDALIPEIGKLRDGIDTLNSKLDRCENFLKSFAAFVAKH